MEWERRVLEEREEEEKVKIGKEQGETVKKKRKPISLDEP